MAKDESQGTTRNSCRGLLNGIIKEPVCTRDCTNASMTWIKGGELFRCEPCREAIVAYDKLGETWAWARPLGRGNSPEQRLPEDIARKSFQFTKRLSGWLSWLY